MNYNELTPTFLTIAAIPAGAFLGALGSKLVAINYKTNWKWGFYGLGVLSIVFAIINYYMIKSEFKLLDYVSFFLFLICGLLIIYFTFSNLDKKYIYKTSELNPIINQFTSLSDKSEIRLFGGDLNFFGNLPTDMDLNDQYNHLRTSGFKKVLILCEEPKDSMTKIRYGKILDELHNVELRFYNPDTADLSIRGRMKKLNGVESLLIYSKIDSGKYQTIKTDMANSNGALYGNIWKLIWSLAQELNPENIAAYVKQFRSWR